MENKTDKPVGETVEEHLNPPKRGPIGKNAVSSNAPPKTRQPSEIEEFDANEKTTPSTSGPKGTEEPGSDKGPGGTDW